MLIVLFPSSVDLSGVATHTLAVARWLAGHGHRVMVVCRASGWLSDELRELEIEVRFINARPTLLGLMRGSAGVARVLSEAMRCRRTEAVILHVHGRMALLCSVLPAWLARNIGAVCTVHQFSDRGRGVAERARQWAEGRALRRQDVVLAVSSALRRQVAGRVGSRVRVAAVPNFLSPVPNARCPANDGRPTADGGHIRLIAIGRLVREKGFDLLVEAISQARAAKHDVTVDIFGAGAEGTALAEQVVSLKLEGYVRLRGSAPEAASLITAYDGVVVPSRCESFSLVVLEAFRAGVPVIASKVPGMHEVTGRMGALLFQRESAQSLAHAIGRFCTDADLRGSLVGAGAVRLRRYDQDVVMRRLLREYEYAVHGKGEYGVGE